MQLFNLVFICLFVTCVNVSAQKLTTEKILVALNVEMDRNCIKNIPRFDDVDYIFENCNINLQHVLLSQNQFKFNPADSLINKYCKKKIVLCGDVIIRKFEVCLSPAQKNYLIHNAVAEIGVLAYICANNGQALKIMAKEGYTNCTNINNRHQCIKMGNEMLDLNVGDFAKETNCRKYLELLDCFAELVKSCDSKNPYYFIKNLAYYAFIRTPCGKYMSGISPFELFEPSPEDEASSIIFKPKKGQDSPFEIDNTEYPQFPKSKIRKPSISSTINLNFFFILFLPCLQVGNILFYS